MIAKKPAPDMIRRGLLAQLGSAAMSAIRSLSGA